MSTYEMADAAGVSQSQVSKIERGINRPSRDTLGRLASAAAYGCPWLDADANVTLLLGLASYWLGRREYESGTVGPRSQWVTVVTSGARLVVEELGRLAEAPDTSPLRPLTEVWSILGADLPGWRPSADGLAREGLQTSRPLWVWALWSAMHRGGESIPETAAFLRHPETLLATVLETLSAIAGDRRRIARDPEPRSSAESHPNDPDWQALQAVWGHLSSKQRRLLLAVACEFHTAATAPSRSRHPGQPPRV